MPYKLVKHRNKTYSVINKINGKVYSYNTTKTKALRQLRLLKYLDVH